MNDYLSNIAARSLRQTEMIVPRLASRYEPFQQKESLDLEDFTSLENIGWQNPDEQKEGNPVPPPIDNEIVATVPSDKHYFRHSVSSIFRFLQKRQDGLKGAGESMQLGQVWTVNMDVARASTPLIAGSPAESQNGGMHEVDTPATSLYDGSFWTVKEEISSNRLNSKVGINSSTGPSIFAGQRKSKPIARANHPHWATIAADYRPKLYAAYERDASLFPLQRSPDIKATGRYSEEVAGVAGLPGIAAVVGLGTYNQTAVSEDILPSVKSESQTKADLIRTSETPYPSDEGDAPPSTPQRPFDGKEVSLSSEKATAIPGFSKITGTAQRRIGNRTAVSEDTLPSERSEPQIKADLIRISKTPLPVDEGDAHSFTQNQTLRGKEIGRYSEDVAEMSGLSGIAAAAQMRIDGQAVLSEERPPSVRSELQIKVNQKSIFETSSPPDEGTPGRTQRMLGPLEERSVDRNDRTEIRNIMERELKRSSASDIKTLPNNQTLHPDAPVSKRHNAARGLIFQPMASPPPARAMNMVEARGETHPLSETTPEIQVTIGRIEVRAIPSQTNPPRNRASVPLMSLDEYLRKRAGDNGR